MEQLFYLGLSLFPGVGPAKFQLLLEKFTSAEKAWNARQENLTEILGEKLASEFVAFREKFDPQEYAKELAEKEIGFVTLVDEEYPKLLKTMTSSFVIPDLDQESIQIDPGSRIKYGMTIKKHHPPFALFYKGNGSLFTAAKTIGIVGTRSISQYGRDVTEMLTKELVEQGFVIVSGLAFGVDGVAHGTCLDNVGKTIAVLGSGVDICTPANHHKLYDSILQNDGLIVSTMLPGQQPTVGSFPARNKIIAGLSLGVIVTEGAADSGALYTADFAKDMGRPIFSVPGPITSRLSAATTQLLKDGAILITSARDVVDTLGIMGLENKKTKVQKEIVSSAPEEQQILDILQIESLHFNEIVRRIGKDSKEIGSLLSLMELKGLIRSNGENYFL